MADRPLEGLSSVNAHYRLLHTLLPDELRACANGATSFKQRIGDKRKPSPTFYCIHEDCNHTVTREGTRCIAHAQQIRKLKLYREEKLQLKLWCRWQGYEVASGPIMECEESLDLSKHTTYEWGLT